LCSCVTPVGWPHYGHNVVVPAIEDLGPLDEPTLVSVGYCVSILKAGSPAFNPKGFRENVKNYLDPAFVS
jgi:hypothetical protein